MIRSTGCRWLSVLVVFVLCATSLGAQSAAPAVEGQPNFMWHIKGAACQGYLLGSVHSAKTDLFPLDPVIEKAFKEADIAVFEVDMADIGDAALEMMARGTLDEDDTLSDILSSETYAATAAFLSDRGMNISGFQKVKPWFLALTMAAVELQRAGYSPDQGIDLHFSRRAALMGKRTMHLETIEEQLDIFTSLEDIEGDEFLRQTLLELEMVIPLMEDVFDAWKNGDAARLEELLLASFADYPTIYRRVVKERNIKWLKEIRRLLEGPDDFMVVVGSLHMVGPDGLVEQLRKQGWTIEQR